MIPAIGYMIGALVFAQFATWIKEDDGPLIMLYLLGLLTTIFCLVWLTTSVIEAQEATSQLQRMMR